MSQRNRIESFEIEVYYDGDCPLCKREINWLNRLDRKQRIRFTDISSPLFDASVTGKTQQQLMAEIHGRLPDGEVIQGVEVFRRLYEAVGFGLVTKATRLPLVSYALDLGYKVFARNRLRMTGRCAGGTCSVKPTVDRSMS